MHVAPADFRSVRTGSLVLRFAMLGDTAYVLAELPRTGSAGSVLEEPCSRPHWAFVVEGAIRVDAGGERRTIDAGNAFYIPPGLEHRLFADGPARLAGFEPVDPDRDLSDDRLRADGYEVLPRPPAVQPGLVVPAPGVDAAREPEAGEIVASSVAMGERILTRARFGARSGYTSVFCDLPHWGLVTDGSLAIEWEDDVEVVTAGDVYYCRSGPPGHRFLAADPAALIDFTPAAAVRSGARVQGWRPLGPPVDRRRHPRSDPTTVEVAPLL
jgi:quercetin dioxygenase-like cupin family protein